MSDAYSPIPELNLLKEFEDRVGVHSYADCFSLLGFTYNDKLHLGRCDDANAAELFDRLIPFAEATASGSAYALWRHDDREDLADLPVIFLGDEGDVWVHARTLREFFRLLPVERDDAFDIDDDLDERNPARQEYLAWLNTHFGLTPPSDEGIAIYRESMREFGWSLAEWLQQFPSYEGVAQDLVDLLEREGISPERTS